MRYIAIRAVVFAFAVLMGFFGGTKAANLPEWISTAATYLAVLSGLGVFANVWWTFPRWQVQQFHSAVRGAAGKADLEDKFRKTLGQFLGGFVLIAGVILTFLEIQTSRESSQSLLKASQAQQFGQQFSKGIEHLGNGDLFVRLGGIYALERVAQTSPDYHWPVIQTLTTYVREKPRRTEKRTPGAISADTQAILTVIGRRNTAYSEGDLDLSKTDLRGASLNKAILFGTNLSGAELSEADLSKANLSAADLSETDLSRADLRGADLSGGGLFPTNLKEADLSRADLRGADLNGTRLGGADLSGADLRETRDLGQFQLKAACGNDKTLLPEGLSVERCKNRVGRIIIRPLVPEGYRESN